MTCCLAFGHLATYGPNILKLVIILTLKLQIDTKHELKYLELKDDFGLFGIYTRL